MELSEDQIIEKLKNVSTATELLYYHTNMILLVSHVDSM